LHQEVDGLNDALGQRTMELERQKSVMKHQALHDVLTGLPNRTLLEERAQQSFQIASREKFSCCLIMIDALAKSRKHNFQGVSKLFECT